MASRPPLRKSNSPDKAERSRQTFHITSLIKPLAHSWLTPALLLPPALMTCPPVFSASACAQAVLPAMASLATVLKAPGLTAVRW